MRRSGPAGRSWTPPPPPSTKGHASGAELRTSGGRKCFRNILLFGDTAEDALARFDCSVLAVKPDNFVSLVELEEKETTQASMPAEGGREKEKTTTT